MALKNCKECGKDVSTSAAACPNCGYASKEHRRFVAKKEQRGFVAKIATAVVVFVGILYFGTNSSANKPTDAPAAVSGTLPAPILNVNKEGEAVQVGYMGYGVWRSWWSSRLTGGSDELPNAKYLFVMLSAVNTDTKARTVPPFTLVDQDGAEYDSDAKGYLLPGSMGLIEQLNPSVHKLGFVVFDVPPGKIYRLKLSGGYWSGDSTFVRLDPAPSMPKHPLERLERMVHKSK